MTNVLCGRKVIVRRQLTKTLLIMKLAAIVMLSTCIAASAHGISQVTITETNAPLEYVFGKIMKQTGYTFFYQPQIMNKAKPVSLHLDEASLDEALKAAFKDQPFSYKIIGKIIAVKAKSPSGANGGKIHLLTEEAGIPIDVSGQVIDDKGQPLAGATIMVKGKTITEQAGLNGMFTITVEERDILIVSFVGYKTTEYKLSGKTQIKIMLQRLEATMDTNVVVYSTGFQYIAKERATGSFVQIDNKTLSRTVSTNILDRLYYTAAGLRKGLNEGGNGFGNSSEITIRGISTVRASQKPLIVVDGFPYEEDQHLTRSPSLLANLNPNDVESITILKDAAAASIWGARSSNGVIVINTKTGKYNQKPKVSLSSSMNIIEEPRIFKSDVMSSKDMIEFEKKEFSTGMYNEYDDVYPGLNAFPTLSPVIEILLAQRRGDISPEEANAQLSVLEKHDVRSDMKKYLLQPAINQQYNLNVSGGTAKMNYYGSVGFDKNRLNTIGNYADRLTIRFGSSFKPLKNLEISGFISYTQFKDKAVDNDALSYLPVGQRWGSAPYLKFTDDNGNFLHVPRPDFATLRTPYIDTVSAHGLLPWHYNPVEELRNSSDKNDNHATRFGGTVKYMVIPGVSVELNGQSEYASNNREQYYSTNTYYTRSMINNLMYHDGKGVPQYPVPLGGIIDLNVNTHRTYNLRAQLNVNKGFGRHEIAAVAGVGSRQSDQMLHAGRFYGFDPNTLTYALNMDFVTLYRSRPEGYSLRISDRKIFTGTLNRELNYYSNIGYNLGGKYNLTASARLDGANIIGIESNQRFKPFWSVGAGWLMSKETFFNASWVNSLNLRLTYGYNGNQDNTVNTMPVVTLFATSDAISFYNNDQWVGRVTPGNPGLSWERMGSVNVAVDFSLFKNRLSGSIDYYSRQITELIGMVRADPTTGQTYYNGNVGRMKAKGVDINLNAVLVNKSVRWVSVFNIAFNREKLVDYFLGEGQLERADTYLYGNAVPGKPVGTVYSYRWGGLDPSNGNPRGMLQGKTVPFTEVLGFNSNWEPNVKPQDLIYHGSVRPLANGNMLNAVSWKNLTLSFNITYALGFYYRTASVDYRTLRNAWSAHGDYARRWQQPGDEQYTYVPSFAMDTRYRFYEKAEVLVRKGDYLYLQDLNLAFDASTLLKNRFQAQVFINAKNLGLLWAANKEGLDPNVAASTGRFPVSREIALGINLNF